MLPESSWPGVPVEVLRRAFELQPDGLDNCAASVACKAWRTALIGSAADSIYLHATTDSQERRWQRLLKSRTSIKSLELVRAAPWSSSSDWFTLQRSDQTAQATLQSIPTACKALTLSEFCSHHLAQYVQKAPQLEQLSFEWGALPFTGFDEMQTMPDLTPLCHLTELEVKMQNDVHGDMFAQLVKLCPNPLQSLKLHRFGSARADNQPPPFSLRTWNLLEHCLPALTKLQLEDCIVAIPGQEITCLSKLSHLSLANSQIYVDGALQVERLTGLTHLDLTATSFHWGGADVDVLDSFTAWPGLLVLKTLGCNMFDSTTRIVLGAVQEAHVSCPVSLDFTNNSSVQIHVHSLEPLTQQKPFQSMSTTEVDAAYKLVAGMVFPLSGRHNAAQGLLQQLSSDFPNLRSLHISGCFHVVPSHAIQVESWGFSQLTDLNLWSLRCSTFNLRCLSSLTSVVLGCTDEHSLDCILLPTSLQSLMFFGCGLFNSGIKQNFLELTCLAEVTLTCHVSDLKFLSWYPVLPNLPCSVRHLTLPTSVQLQHFINWTKSNGCQSVRHLTLELPPDLDGPLDEWFRCLPHLSVVEYYSYASDSGAPTGTRIPPVRDIPNWLDDPHVLGALM